MQNNNRHIFIAREGLAAKFIAHKLAQCTNLDGIIIELGKKAKKRKLKRLFKGKIWEFPPKILDLLFIYRLNKVISKYIENRMIEKEGVEEYPDKIPLFVFDDVNDRECITKLNELAPDVLIVFGTSILKKPIIEIPKSDILNIHGGIVPKYRNVHSEFWAMAKDDLDMIGTSIIHLDIGIDSGAVALQKTLKVEGNTSLAEIKYRNLKLSAELICEALALHDKNELPYIPQKKDNMKFFKTPKYKDWRTFRHKIRLT